MQRDRHHLAVRFTPLVAGSLMVVALAASACAERAAPDAVDSIPGGVPDVSVVDSAVSRPDSASRCAASAGGSVTVHGIGPLCAGMTVEEAQTALKDAFSVSAASDAMGCTYATWPNAPAGVMVMVENRHVVRVEVQEPGVRTTEGAGVGDTEAQIMALYTGRVASTPHKYSDGKYLTVTPLALADSAYRLIFEVEEGKVTKYRSGTRPQVEYVEGCS